MSTVLVARKEVRDAIRSRTLLGVTALFVAFSAGGVTLLAAVPVFSNGAGSGDPLAVLFGLLAPAGLFVPIIGLLVGFKAVVGERERGSVYCLLGLAHDRLDVVAGKFLGRATVVAIATAAGFAAGAVALLAVEGPFQPLDYLLFTLLTILLGATFVGLGVGLSAATGSTTRAAWGAFSLLVLFQFLWEVLRIGALYAVTGSLPEEPPFPNWYVLLSQLNPQAAYSNAAMATLSDGNPLVDQVAGSPPFFVQEWFGLLVLVAWGAVPLALGYLRFRAVDL